MEKFSEIVEKLFLSLLKAVHYLMKISLGLVIGIILGILFFIIISDRLGEIFFVLFSLLGLIGGIIYAERARRSASSPYYKQKNPED